MVYCHQSPPVSSSREPSNHDKVIQSHLGMLAMRFEAISPPPAPHSAARGIRRVCRGPRRSCAWLSRIHDACAIGNTLSSTSGGQKEVVFLFEDSTIWAMPKPAMTPETWRPSPRHFRKCMPPRLISRKRSLSKGTGRKEIRRSKRPTKPAMLGIHWALSSSGTGLHDKKPNGLSV